MYEVAVARPNKKAYYYPSEAQRYYGSYSRDGITIHWWGGGEGADKHDSIVNYFIKMGDQGRKSVNYVASDNKLTEMVPATDVAWTNGHKSNANNITIEVQPTLGADGYKRIGWLIWQQRVRFGKSLPLNPHNKWVSTQCPGTISLDRLEQEAQKWARGEYNPQPQKPEWQLNLRAITPFKAYAQDQAPLVDLNTGAVKQRFALDTAIDVGAETSVQGIRYLMSQYSYDKKLPNAIPAVQLKATATPPQPTPTPQPEWVTNLQDIDNTTYYLTENSNLVDITTNKDLTKPFIKGEEFTASAKTHAHGKDFVITEYSYQKRIYNGLPMSVLSITPPSAPPIPPEPVPTPQPIDKAGIIAIIQDIIAKLGEIIKKLGG